MVLLIKIMISACFFGRKGTHYFLISNKKQATGIT